jgi:tetratricopeptide (TPR) repeat protein
MGRTAEAQTAIADSLALDRLDFRMMAEQFLLTGKEKDRDAFVAALEGDIQTLLDVSFDLAWSGLQKDALVLLQACCNAVKWEYPLLWYTLSWLASALNRKTAAFEYLVTAEAASPRYCFPARLEEMIVLEDAVRRNPSGAKAHYYLGNLYYDKRRYADAIRSWRRSIELDDSFSIPLRNLGIAEFNVLHDAAAADRMYERAFQANRKDARLLYEWDQLKKRAVLASPAERLAMLNQHQQLVDARDDLTVEYVTLLNQSGQHRAALELLSHRRFSPWEGGEGLVSGQYVQAHKALGRAAMADEKFRNALDHFQAARNYPENLGEGKHLLTLERDLDYYSGITAQKLGESALADRYWTAAAAPLPSASIHSYFQARALMVMDESAAAREVVQELARFAEEKMATVPKIDYFATSLPNLLLFDDDLERRNRIESTVLAALASDGLGKSEKAVELLEQVIAEDPNHVFAIEMVEWLKVEGKAAAREEIEGRPVS